MSDQLPPQQPYQPPAGGSTSQPLSDAEDVQWASFAHLGGILGFLPSLIIWLIFKDRGRFTNQEAKEALNFQLTMLGATIVLNILVFIVGAITFGLGFLLGLLLWVPWLLGVIFSIIAFLKVKDATPYRYPITIRMIK